MKFFLKVLLVLTGVTVLAAVLTKRRYPEFGEPLDGSFRITAVMDGREFMSVTPNLMKGEAVACMGGIELDLTEANIGDGAILELKAIMGGIEVLVPPTWRVEMRSISRMSGVVNLTDPDEPADGPLLLVDADALMGGIVVMTPESTDGS